MFRVSRRGEGIDDAETIEGAREIVRGEPPSRYEVDEIRAVPIGAYQSIVGPDDPASRRAGRGGTVAVGRLGCPQSEYYPAEPVERESPGDRPAALRSLKGCERIGSKMKYRMNRTSAENEIYIHFSIFDLKS